MLHLKCGCAGTFQSETVAFIYIHETAEICVILPARWVDDRYSAGICITIVSRHCRVLAAQGYSKNGASDEGDTMQSIVAHCVAAYSWMT